MTTRKPGEQNVVTFKQWSATMTDNDFMQIVFRGNLNRKEVARACGFAKSVLQQNPKVKELLECLEGGLRARKVLPELTELAIGKNNQPQTYDQNTNKLIADTKRASKLEVENLELKGKIKVLENQLQRYAELSEVMSGLGIMPR